MRQARLVLAMVAVLALSYGLVVGWRSLLRLPELNLDLGRGNRPRADDVSAGRAYAIGVTTTRHALSGATRLRVENPFGGVTLVPGGSQVEVKQSVYARGATHAAADQEARRVRVEAFRDGEALAVRVTGDRRTRDVGVDLAITLPPALAANVGTVDGDITARGLRADFRAHSVSGRIATTDLGGHLAATTTSGDIHANGVPGGAELHTVSGDANLVRLTGEAELSTVSGSVGVEALRTTRLAANSTSGDLRLITRTPFSGRLRARTVSGSVTISLPPGSDCDVRTQSVSGTVTGGLASRAGAPGLIEVHTVSGDITLRNGDGTTPSPG